MPFFSYSSNETNYRGAYQTREGAIQEAQREGLAVFWTGQNRSPDVCAGIDVDRFLESVTDTEDFYIEQAENWPECSREKKQELEQMLCAAFKQWINENNLGPKFWLVEDVQKHEIQAQGAR